MLTIPIFITVVIILVLLSRIDWKKLAIKWVSNKPDKAVLYRDLNNYIDKYLCVLDVKSNTDKGIGYICKNTHNKKIKLILPLKYPYKWIDGVRMILMKNDKLVNPFSNKALLSKPDETTELDNQLIDSRIAVQLLQSIKGNSIPWGLLIILIIVGVVAYVTYKIFVPAPVIAPPTITPIPIPTPIIPLGQILIRIILNG